MKKYIGNSAGFVLLTALLTLFAVSFNSCKDSPFFYSVYINNNTANHLFIYEKGGTTGNFYKVAEVGANSSYKEKGFLRDKEYTLEARKDNGTVVVATKTLVQTANDDVTWDIN